MLVYARGNRHDIGVEDYVVGSEAGFFSKEPISAAADFSLSGKSVGLACFVKGHHDDGRAETAYQRGFS